MSHVRMPEPGEPVLNSQGERIDQFLETKPARIELTILGILHQRFNYVECVSCGKLLETVFLTSDLIKDWKFDPSSLLRPSVLQVARATCPVCQELHRQFAKVFRE